MDGIMTSKLFTTRQGTILLGVIAAVIAAVALIVYLNQYRDSVNNNNAVLSVLVAKQVIEPGTPGDVLGAGGLYEIQNIAKSNVKAGALVDPSTLTGKVAVTQIYKGQQLTAADFGPGTNSLTQQLGSNQRAVVIPLEAPQQVGGQISSGSRVDVWVSLTGGSGAATRPIVEQLLGNVYVLGTNGGNVTLRTTPQEAGQLIYASLNAQVWLVLRGNVGSTKKPPTVTGLKARG